MTPPIFVSIYTTSRDSFFFFGPCHNFMCVVVSSLFFPDLLVLEFLVSKVFHTAPNSSSSSKDVPWAKIRKANRSKKNKSNLSPGFLHSTSG